MKLSKRLNAIKKLVEKGSILADIGCDHAYLSCACILECICVKAYASDINEGPLKQAMANIKELHLEEKVIPILSNGLHSIPSDCDVVVISGMGFETIKLILENDFHRLKDFKQIILQSNSDLELLRGWISDHKYQITHEKIVQDGHYYQIISIKPMIDRELCEQELYFGVHLNQDPLFIPYYKQQRTKYKEILAQLSFEHPKYSEISNRINQIDAQLKNEF